MKILKKCIVTGANGFVGYWLVKCLCEHGAEVIAVVRNEEENISMLEKFNNVKVVYCDLNDYDKLSARVGHFSPEVFYHIAWAGAGGAGRANYELQLMNVKGSCDAVKAAKEMGCSKILFAGTITEKIARNAAALELQSENVIYGISKNAAHNITSVLSKKLGIDCVWMQFANLFGPYSINGNIIGYTIDSLMNGEDATFGSATQMYDFLYIEDLVYAAYLLGKTKASSGEYYLGSGNPRPLRDYLLEVGSIMGKPDKIKLGVRPDDGLKYEASWYSTEKLASQTGFKVRVGFQEGINRTIDWRKR